MLIKRPSRSKLHSFFFLLPTLINLSNRKRLSFFSVKTIEDLKQKGPEQDTVLCLLNSSLGSSSQLDEQRECRFVLK